MKTKLQYVSDEKGEPVSVIVPIDLWREISSARETARLLDNPPMREKLLRSLAEPDVVSFEEVCAKFGVAPEELEADDASAARPQA